MININSHKKIPKAVGMLSGGLDSSLAAKVVKDLGVEVYGVYFAMPWGCCDKTAAFNAAQKIGINFITLQLDERYLEIVRKPRFGYGTAMNPCVDCRIHMFSRAAQYMRHIGADFVFTGEVLGQRPMSQMRHSMRTIEKETGLEGRLLRPLCAQLLEPTIPEEEGLIDRAKLLQFNGRGRSAQLKLAEELGVTDYNPVGGGCLLTDHNFARRMKDTLKHGYRNFRETTVLKWGRHFRINDQIKIILGRDEEENKGLVSFAHPNDSIMEPENFKGPTVLLKTENPDENTLKIAGGLSQFFSKSKNLHDFQMIYWKADDRNNTKIIPCQKINEFDVEKWKI